MVGSGAGYPVGGGLELGERRVLQPQGGPRTGLRLGLLQDAVLAPGEQQLVQQAGASGSVASTAASSTTNRGRFMAGSDRLVGRVIRGC
ncbi:hypothetical protein C0216_30860 (plasmid) [Streptomyces globosus]|uniref:Uncharacterized protein n=1 Tax=Streptomyces globosus TaxID=68209 RepID=A0A344UAI7_9ACTN|nr:hypothetical protein C0216_30860 [Streptomyces globosus]